MLRWPIAAGDLAAAAIAVTLLLAAGSFVAAQEGGPAAGLPGGAAAGAVFCLGLAFAIRYYRGTGPVGRPRIPSVRWLRTFGSFRVGRAVATMTV